MTNSHPESEHSFDGTYRDREELFGTPYQELQDYFNNRPTKGTVLDIGSGQGRDALYLAQIGYQVTAVDISTVGVEQMLKQAEEQELRIEGIVADIVELQLEKSYDLVLFDMILHAFDEPEQIELLKKYANNLNKDGYMVLVFPDDMETEHIMRTLNSLPHQWELMDEIVIRDLPQIDDEEVDFTFAMKCIKRL